MRIQVNPVILFKTGENQTTNTVTSIYDVLLPNWDIDDNTWFVFYVGQVTHRGQYKYLFHSHYMTLEIRSVKFVFINAF